MGARSLLLFSDGDAVRATELRRVKALATMVLAATFALFVLSKWLLPLHPAFGFVAAFAEAATIGGLADWYAVVALFRRPLGLPIPHTAIIQSNQRRIADKLGEFIRDHFLGEAPIEAKLRQVDFASFIADWLSDRKRSGDLSRFGLRLLPDALAAGESSGLKSFLTRRILGQLQGVNLAPLAAGALRAFVQRGRHQALLDDFITAVHGALTKPETISAIREKVRDELPTLLRFYRTDAYLVKKIAASAGAFFEDIRNDPEHPFRGEFDRMVVAFADRLENEPDYAARIASLQKDVLDRPELARLTQSIWSNVVTFIKNSADGENSVLQHHLTSALVEVGRALAADADMRGEINSGLVVVLRSFVADQKNGVATFIADQVKSWDMSQLIALIEINVGRDLQYIRFNGSLIGGLAGLALYSAEVLLRML